jgi:hypothetical protein
MHLSCQIIDSAGVSYQDHELSLFSPLTVLAASVVLDRASELVGINPNKSFAKKLEQLHSDRHIGAADKETVQVLTDAGSVAAHRGWEPDTEQLAVLTSIIEHFVTRFILKEEAGKLRQFIPPRQN